MQFLWKYIDDLIGKGLSIMQVSELMMYSIARFVPLALPIAVLISSVMVVGKLGENYELAAMQSSGISLFKIFKPLFIVILFIATSSYLFSNYVMPIANYKGGSLLYDIKKKKPSVNIKEGIFYNDIDGYSIKIENKVPNNILFIFLSVQSFGFTLFSIAAFSAGIPKLSHPIGCKTLKPFSL